ncbi:Acryloyl-CoA reductase (NADH) [Paraburkholderia caffeinitolerans]|uniref:Acryloyl-CoA reductase (NADH) n=1 Tax=Paraburkholderia caffeinitolerans TaxID=1723730 RepID=A0A6J5FSF0_9BURK|nr:acyl-CoA dehydrogenase family protein [Paraburkholderia caffeinitolerans]CAB3785885.1 Acryloyl-CoA reductase (NADH) [Paraburkholderia caffeinitolerans]
MDLVLTEEQVMIRDSAAEVLAQQSASADVRRAIARHAGYDAALWQTVAAELGWCGLSVPEHAGGAGLGATALVLLMEQLGARLACVPYFGTAVLAAQALARCTGDPAEADADEGSEEAVRWLARIAAGETRAALAIGHAAPSDAGECQAVSVEAHETPDGFRLSGTLAAVLDGVMADLLLVPARLANNDSGEIALFAVETAQAGVARTPLATLDTTRAFAGIVLDDVQVMPAACLARGVAVRRALTETAWLAALGLAAEQLGGAQQCLDLTLAYTAERVQFGRAIASFQAVKHRCAEMLVAVEAARSAVLGAAAAWDAAQGVPTAALYADIAVAKASANDAFRFCAQEAIQLHGGVGFTWEYDPQLYFKRAQASGALFGSTSQLYGWLAGHVIDGASGNAAVEPTSAAALAGANA